MEEVMEEVMEEETDEEAAEAELLLIPPLLRLLLLCAEDLKAAPEGVGEDIRRNRRERRLLHFVRDNHCFGSMLEPLVAGILFALRSSEFT